MKNRKPTPKPAWQPPKNPCGHTKPMHDGNDWHCIRERHDDTFHYYVRTK